MVGKAEDWACARGKDVNVTQIGAKVGRGDRAPVFAPLTSLCRDLGQYSFSKTSFAHRFRPPFERV